jgi:general secretion pathway protein J
VKPARGPTVQRTRFAARQRARGLTLLEIMVAMAVLAMVSALVYGALDGMSQARSGITRLGERHHQGRAALSRIARELAGAFLSVHLPPTTVMQTARATGFVGTDGAAFDRVDFTAFAHQRIGRDAHESDQCEVGYFASRDPDARDKVDLVRREAPIDDKVDKGGVVQVLAEDIERFQVAYLDPLTNEWTETWDSLQPAGQLGRLPSQVKVIIEVRGGAGGRPIRFATRVTLPMQWALAFGMPLGYLPRLDSPVPPPPWMNPAIGGMGLMGGAGMPGPMGGSGAPGPVTNPVSGGR